MTIFVTKTVRKVGTIAPGRALELKFNPAQGAIQGSASNAYLLMGWGLSGLVSGDRSTARRLEIVRADGTVAGTLGADTAATSHIDYAAAAAESAGNSQWTFRVTNLEPKPVKCVALVKHNTAAVLKTATVPVSLINAVLPLLGLSKIKIHIETGENADDKRCFVDVGPSPLRDGLVANGATLPLRFNVPKRTIGLWLLPDPVVRLRDINSQTVTLSVENATTTFPNGFLRLGVRFEENGTEVVVDNGPDADIKNMKLTVDLGLAALDGEVSFGRVDATFPIDVDIHGPFEWLIDLVIDVTKILRRAVESSVEEFLDTSAMRARVGDSLTAELRKVPGLGMTARSRIHSIKVAAGQVTITYSEP